jgi:predicted exporter
VTRARWIPLLVGTLVLAALAQYVRVRLDVRNDITGFLPEGRDRRASLISRELAASELARTMILSIEAPGPEQAASGARAFARALAGNPDVAWIRSGVDDGAQRAAYDAYFPRRLYFASDRPDEELAPRLTDEGLRGAARDLKVALASPLGPLVARVAPQDPLLFFSGQLTRLRAAQDDSLHLQNDQFVSADGKHGILFLGTKANPFDSESQERLLGSIDAAFDRVNRDAGGVLKLESSGINRFNVSVERGVKADIERISIASTVGVVVLFLLIFRSLRYVVLGMIPLAAGTICAMAAGIALFGSLQGLTLAFGSSLIGVGIDYAEHYFSHYTVAPDPDGPEAGLRRIWPGLAIGALTTIAGLAGLAWTSFPGLREIAVFSAVGVAAALLSTRWFLPPLMPRRPRPIRLQQRAARLFGRLVLSMMDARRRLVWLPLAGMALCGLGLPRIHWIDDVSALNALDPALVAEDLRVRGRVARADPGRFVVVTGRDDEDALSTNDEVARRLRAARDQGLLDNFSSVHSIVWASRLQERSRDALTRDPTLPHRLAAAFSAEGFVGGAFAPFARDLSAPPPPPLTVGEILKSPFGDLLRPFRVEVDGRVVLVTLVGGVRDAGALAARLGGLDDVFFLDQRMFLDEAYGRFRARTLEMIGVGLLLVFLIVHARYRRFRLSLAAFLPGVLGVAVTLAGLSLFGIPLNLMHLVGVLLVLSMGTDYGVFVVESRDHPEELGATILSLVVAMLSTVLSFGLLGMSTNPAMAALGITAAVGTFLSVVFAPAALVLLQEQES